MYKPIKHKHEDRSKIFFSSDWHNFHDPKWDNPIWKMRGYSSHQESAEDVIEKINARVGESDFLYFGGDGFLNATDEQVVEWFGKIKCQNISYLWGNHSSNTFRLYKQEVKKQFGFDDLEVYPVRMGNVVFLGDYQEIQVGSQHIVFGHFPLHSHNHMRRTSWNLSGHQHCEDPTRTPDCLEGLRLDVGWDWKKDVWSFEEVGEVMGNKTRFSEGHH